MDRGHGENRAGTSASAAAIPLRALSAVSATSLSAALALTSDAAAAVAAAFARPAVTLRSSAPWRKRCSATLVISATCASSISWYMMA